MVGAGLLLPLVLAPVLRSGTSSIALAVSAIAGTLAWISPALPAALSGAPGVVVSLTGSDVLPAGGTVTLLSLWALLGVALAIGRAPRRYPLALFLRPTVSLSVSLAVLMLLRLGSSPAEDYGSTKLQLFFLVNLVGLVAGVAVGRRRHDFDLYVIVLFAVNVFSCLALLRSIAAGGAQEVFAGRQSLSADVNPIFLARSLAEGALICVYFLVGRYVSTTLRIMSFALLPLFAVALVATGSRGPLLALLVGLAVLLTLVLRQGQGLRYTVVFLGAVVASVVVVPRMLSTPGAIDRALSLFTDAGSGLSSNGREVLWNQAIEAVSLHPLLGLGTGGFAAIQPLERYPHNLFLEAAAEMGVVGLVLVVAVIATGIVYLVDAWNRGTESERSQVALTSALLATAVVNANFSGDITGNSSVWFAVGLATGLQWRGARAGRVARAGSPNGSDTIAAPRGTRRSPRHRPLPRQPT